MAKPDTIKCRLAASALVEELQKTGANEMKVVLEKCKDEDGDDMGDFEAIVRCIRDPYSDGEADSEAQQSSSVSGHSPPN